MKVKVIEGRGISPIPTSQSPKGGCGGGVANAQSPCSTSLRCLAMGKCARTNRKTGKPLFPLNKTISRYINYPEHISQLSVLSNEQSISNDACFSTC